MAVAAIALNCLLAASVCGCQSKANAISLTAEDRAQILDLFARYCQYIDAHQGKAYASTFTTDGELIFPGIDVKGPDALAAFATRNDPNRFALHFVGDVMLVPVGPGEVHARSKVILGRRAANSQSARFDAFGTYEDDILKTPQGWKFAKRRADTDLPISAEFISGG